jgi:hypothetical protein
LTESGDQFRYCFASLWTDGPQRLSNFEDEPAVSTATKHIPQLRYRASSGWTKCLDGAKCNSTRLGIREQFLDSG